MLLKIAVDERTPLSILILYNRVEEIGSFLKPGLLPVAHIFVIILITLLQYIEKRILYIPICVSRQIL